MFNIYKSINLFLETINYDTPTFNYAIFNGQCRSMDKIKEERYVNSKELRISSPSEL